VEKILVFEGTKVEMQEKARGYYQSIRGLVLWETGREITVTFSFGYAVLAATLRSL
jgi:hypothetical protein